MVLGVTYQMIDLDWSTRKWYAEPSKVKLKRLCVLPPDGRNIFFHTVFWV